MDDFVIRWAGRIRWVCLGFMGYDLVAGKTFWAIIMLVCSAICFGITEDLKRMRDRSSS